MEALGEVIQRAMQSDRPSQRPQPRAGDVMSTEFIAFHPEDGIQHAVRTMLRKKISGGPVVDGHGHLLGMLSELDCLRVLAGVTFHADGFGDAKLVEQVMTPRRDLKVVAPDTGIYDIAHDFLYNGFRRLPVVHNGKVVGHISRTDILHHLADLCAEGSPR